MSVGIKVLMGKHDLSIHADIAGFSLICACGWTHAVRYPAYVAAVVAEREGRQAHAAHVRHMALVHDAQTHSNANCGRSCIYPRADQGGDDVTEKED